MKGWKKCTVFLLALVICLSLAACGVGSSKGESEDYYTPGVIEDTDYDFTDDNPAEQLGYDSIEDMSYSKICFEGDTTEYFWRER